MTDQESPKFEIGDRVERRTGYRYPGIVRNRFKMPRGWRYDVEADHPYFEGMLHIFNGEQLRIRKLEDAESEVTVDPDLTHAVLAQMLDDCDGDLELAAKMLAASALWHMAKVEDLMARLCAKTDAGMD